MGKVRQLTVLGKVVTPSAFMLEEKEVERFAFLLTPLVLNSHSR